MFNTNSVDKQTRWIWVDSNNKQPNGIGKTYAQALAEAKNNKTSEANRSELIDTALSVFREYNKSGDRKE